MKEANSVPIKIGAVQNPGTVIRTQAVAHSRKLK